MEQVKKLIQFKKCGLSIIVLSLTLMGWTSSAMAAKIRMTLGEYSANTKKSYEKIAADFEAANPDIDVVIEVIPWSTYRQALTTDIFGGNAPDISVVASIWLKDYAGQGLLEPMENLMSPGLKEKFIPAMLGPSYVDGQLMGLPIAASARAMLINAELFKKANVPPPNSWEQFQAASAAISEVPGAYGFGLPGKEEEVDVYFYYIFWSFGGKIFDENGRSGLDSPEAIAAAKVYADLIKNGHTQPSPTANSREDVFNLFIQGKVGAVFTYPMLIPQIKSQNPDLNYQVLPFPVEKHKVTMGITDSIVVFKESESKAEVTKFMDFMYQHKYRLAFNQADGLLPVITSVVQDDYYQTNQDIKAFADGLAYARFQPLVEGYDDIIEITRNTLQKVYLGAIDPEEAFKTAAAEINKRRGLN